MDIKKTFQEVNQELGLYETPDWGIINGTADRAKDFIQYYNTNRDLLENSTKFDFSELIIASMNEAIIENKRDEELNFLFKEYIYEHLDDKFILFNVIGYWMSIANEEEFPVGFLLDQIVPKDM